MNEINSIKNQIREMEEFKTNIERHQLSYPVDIDSMNTIRGDAFYQVGEVIPYGLVTYNEPTEVKVGNKKYLLYATEFVDISI